MKQIEYFGFNSINNLEGILENEKARRVFLVTGKESFKSCGAEERITRILTPYQSKRFTDFSPNPQEEQIERGYKDFEKFNPDIILGVGGGSAIDVAKALKEFLFERKNKNIPLVAIPTTAGTGSEATHYIVYYSGKNKVSAGKPELTLPNYSICDPQFTLNLPKNVTASTGLDAFGQAVESYWSIRATEKTKKIAGEAITLVLNNLEEAVNQSSRNSRESMMKSANLSGKAIDLTLTTACHAISYPFTSYFGIPHGHAVALTLGSILVYNSEVNEKDCLDKRGASYVKKSIETINHLLGCRTAEESKKKIEQLMERIGMKTKLSELGLKEDDLDIIVKNGFNLERVKNNPRLLTEQNLRTLLKNIF